MKRIAAVITLALLSPLIAEYLSGSLSLAEFGALPVMLAMYGGGAVVIRETVRRSGRGWLSILLLGLAYALVEEGIADQSLFNPNFQGLRLLDPGFIPALGIGVPWTLYVLAIHVIWSIAVPIALAESLFPSMRREPWMGRIGVTVAAFFYVAGVALITVFFAKKFFASPAQIAASAIGAAVLIVAAFVLPREKPTPASAGPRPWIIAVASFLATSAFVLLYGQGVSRWPWLAASGMAALLVLMLAFAIYRRWTPAQIYAAAAGALLTYGWSGFFSEIALHGPAMLPAHAGLAAVLGALLVIAGFPFRGRRPEG
jgi:hypothetical protein